MNVLVLSFYYPPDLCPGSFRTVTFVESLQTKLRDKDRIDVVTTYPNRYHSYNADFNQQRAQGNNIFIKRLKIPAHKSGLLDQSKSFAIFFIKALRWVDNKDYDAIFVTSSRLFTAFLGFIISRKKKKPLYLDIRDIFHDTLKSMFTGSIKGFILPLIGFVEMLTMTGAKKINLVSKGFEDYFRKRYPHVPLSFYSNGIDTEFIEFDFGNFKKNERLSVTYAGNIGEGQGLEKILPLMAKTYPQIDFTVIGDGGKKSALMEETKECKNVFLLPPVPRDELLEIYKKSDCLFLHLNDYSAFKKVLPSKLFEYGATGKLVIAGVSGYAGEFLRAHLPNSIVFRPGDIQDLKRQFPQGQAIFQKPNNGFIEQFARAKIMDELSEDFLNTVRP